MPAIIAADVPRPRLQSMWERHYAEAFGPTETALPFLNYYTVTPEKTLACETFTRGEFLALATRAKGVLAARGVAAGDRVTHFFTENSHIDLGRFHTSVASAPLSLRCLCVSLYLCVVSTLL